MWLGAFLAALDVAAASAGGTPPEPDAAAVKLQRLVDGAVAAGARTITVPGGKAYFGLHNFNITGAVGLRVLPSSPLQLLFGGATGVNVTDCVDLDLSDFSIGYVEGAEGRRDGIHDGRPPVTKHELAALGSKAGITLNLLNCTRVTVRNANISNGWFMIVTAWNGGGDHRFDGVRFGPGIGRVSRDALHFSDQRKGPTFENCMIGYTGDDLFNIHTTLMVVLRCEAAACYVVNPHLSGPGMRNTVYGSNSVMEMVGPGERMSFWRWPTARLATAPVGPGPATVVSAARVGDAALLAEAATLVPELEEHRRLNPVSLRNTTVGWHAWDLWHVEFAGPVPAGVGRTTYVQIDTINNSGTVLRNNLFTDTNCNLGRFKSSHSVIHGNTFRNAKIPSLELSWLPQFFEGPVVLENVSLTQNVITGEGARPVHCGPGCGLEGCLYDGKDAPVHPWTEAGCPECPDCFAGDTAWTRGIHLAGNTITP